MKQTAVEWLVETLNNKIDYIPIKHWDYLRETIQQANAMFEEQIIDTYKKAQVLMVMDSNKQAEQYYNETFKSE